jgi:hypothetical protein
VANQESATLLDLINAKLNVDIDGNLKVAFSGTASVSIDTSALATGAKQDTGNASLASIDTKLSKLSAGQSDSAHSVSIVLASDHPSLTATIDETTLATSAKQDTGNASLASIDTKLTKLSDGTQKTQVVGAGGQVQPSGDAAARPIFVQQSDGTSAVVVSTSAKQDTGNTSLGNIATHQTDGTQKTQVVGSGGQVMPAGDAAGRPVFVQMSDGTSAVGTSGNPVRTQEKAPAGSTDPGQNVSLSVGNTVVQAASAAAPSGWVAINIDPDNSDKVSVARANTVTAGPTGKGLRLSAGDTIILQAANANEFYFVAATATQNVHVLAL